MASITSWNRLDPVSRHKDLAVGLQAQMHDPLWMLARQWQTLEFQATDAGSPVWAYFTTEHRPLAHLAPGQSSLPGTISLLSDDRPLPLETLIEREVVRWSDNLRLAAEAGLYLLRLLRTQFAGKYRSEYVNEYPLVMPEETPSLDEASRRFIGLMAGRVPDGNKLSDALENGALGLEPFIVAGDGAAVGQIVKVWGEWYSSLFSEPAITNPPTTTPPAWVPERLEYTFRVSAEAPGGTTVLAAPEFGSGSLDWHAFDVQTDTTTGAPVRDQSEAIPTPVSFPGMPATRWWQFEDARVDYGAVTAQPVDLARMSFVELALTYGNDWFLIPVELPVGTVCWEPWLEVIDSFGERITIPHYSDADDGKGEWQLFRLSGQDSSQARSSFFLPPTLGPILESSPVEDVLFLRDELTNLAWAVEKTVESPGGRPLNRYEAYQDTQRRHQQETTPPTPDGLTYKLGLSVPDYWLPLSPADRPGGLRLELLSLPRMDGTIGSIDPQGRVLEPGTSLSLFGEEITRAGVEVTRTYQYARWINGETFLWVGRRKRTGRGEGSSGLRFDVLLPER